jgi:hypothetical protein
MNRSAGMSAPPHTMSALPALEESVECSPLLNESDPMPGDLTAELHKAVQAFAIAKAGESHLKDVKDVPGGRESGSGDAKEIIPVEFSVKILSIDGIDDKAQTFDATFQLHLRWEVGPGDTVFKKQSSKVSEKTKAWEPRIEWENQVSDEGGQVKEREDEGSYGYRVNHKGKDSQVPAWSLPTQAPSDPMWLLIQFVWAFTVDIAPPMSTS